VHYRWRRPTAQVPQGGGGATRGVQIPRGLGRPVDHTSEAKADADTHTPTGACTTRMGLMSKYSALGAKESIRRLSSSMYERYTSLGQKKKKRNSDSTHRCRSIAPAST